MDVVGVERMVPHTAGRKEIPEVQVVRSHMVTIASASLTLRLSPSFLV